jgi:aminoglycoside phosphotransferase (APT) family kinase protein
MIEITTELVQKLISAQFPAWIGLPVRFMENGGNDNRTFRLGDELLVRLPASPAYAPQSVKEFEWLPKLGKYMTLPIPSVVAKGKPAFGYPFSWLVTRYIQGETATPERIVNSKQFALDLGGFLKELQSADTKNAPTAGQDNFYRGGNLLVYHDETLKALDILKHKKIYSEEILNTLESVWNFALCSKWENPPVWVHGDVAASNLLVNNGSLCAVIDFGCSAIGDPACDYVMGWTFFNADDRKIFLSQPHPDNNTVNRARGWALWKALITHDSTDKTVHQLSKQTIHAILNESPCPLFTKALQFHL